MTNNNFIDSRPQELCKMCGLCCRLVTASESYEQLLIDSSNGVQDAIDFLNIFIPYSSTSQARLINDQHVNNILNTFPLEERSKVIFYHCRFLLDDNKCSIYENRPLLCRRCPASPWVVMPPDCGFLPYLQEKRYEIINYIKKVKLTLLTCESFPDDYFLTSRNITIKQLKSNLLAKITPFLKYGAQNW